MKTFQDFQAAVAAGEMIDFLCQAINEHRSSSDYRIALDADEYEAQRNVTIRNWVKYLYTMDGRKVPDFTASNNKLANNFYHRLNTQRRTYSLGNGVSFTNTEEVVENGVKHQRDVTKEFLGTDFDTALNTAADFGLRHKVSFIFWNYDHGDVFKYTEFVPLWDEEDGSLKAGIRFWSLDWNQRPVVVVLYEEDGYTKFHTKPGSKGLDLELLEEKTAYKQIVATSEADGDVVVGEENYSSLPIVPLWGSKHKQSTLVGMRDKLDAYDLIDSGFANDLQECAEIYWLIGNALGETDESLAKFMDRLKLNHVAAIDSDNSKVTPYTQEIPTEARKTFLEELRNQIYEDFGALDVHTVAAGATNDHIDAAYQPMDEEADDFEYQIIKCVRQILKLNGIDDTPQFKRNRISNQKEQVDMIMSCANYLDDETVLSKLPFVTVDEVQEILKKKEMEDAARIKLEQENNSFGNQQEEQEE